MLLGSSCLVYLVSLFCYVAASVSESQGEFENCQEIDLFVC